MGVELRAYGANYSGATCINLARHPGWGRTQESYGEDPLILGTMGTALVRGIRDHSMACVKHFALNSMEDMRFEVDVQIDEQTLHEVYLPHFKQTLEEGEAESLMTAYNLVNGECCGENEALIGLVRRDWGMTDLIFTSDWVWGVRDGPKSVKAGLDVEMPWACVRKKSLRQALACGDLTFDDVERPCLRILAAQLIYYARLRSPAPGPDRIGCKEHRHLAKQVAAEGMVLLKNSSGSPLLPLDRHTHKEIAVIGRLAKSTQTGDNGSSSVRDSHVISPLAGFHANPSIQTVYYSGADIATSVRAAKSADVVFVLVGYSAVEEGESVLCTEIGINRICLPGWAGSWLVCFLLSYVVLLLKVIGFGVGGDRRALRLRPHDEQLVKAIVAEVGHKTILGIESSSTVILPHDIRRDCASILWTGYGGTQFGHALQDVLWGKSEPSGRLPFVIPESEDHLPTWQPSARKVKYDRWFGYRLLQKSNRRSIYPFGFGLGYSEFKFIEGKFQVPQLTERFFQVLVEVENIGQRGSSVVVQIYAGKEDPNDRSEIDYASVLIGFRKEFVEPSARKAVRVDCRLNPIAHWNPKTRGWELDPGSYMICASRWEGDERSVVTSAVAKDRVRWT